MYTISGINISNKIVIIWTCSMLWLIVLWTGCTISYTQPYSYHSAFFPPPGSSSSSSSTTDEDSSPPLAAGDLPEDAAEADDLPGLGGSWGAAVESRDTPGARAEDCFLAGSVGGALKTQFLQFLGIVQDINIKLVHVRHGQIEHMIILLWVQTIQPSGVQCNKMLKWPY